MQSVKELARPIVARAWAFIKGLSAVSMKSFFSKRATFALRVILVLSFVCLAADAILFTVAYNRFTTVTLSLVNDYVANIQDDGKARLLCKAFAPSSSGARQYRECMFNLAVTAKTLTAKLPAIVFSANYVKTHPRDASAAERLRLAKGSLRSTIASEQGILDSIKMADTELARSVVFNRILFDSSSRANFAKSLTEVNDGIESDIGEAEALLAKTTNRYIAELKMSTSIAGVKTIIPVNNRMDALSTKIKRVLTDNEQSLSETERVELHNMLAEATKIKAASNVSASAKKTSK